MTTRQMIKTLENQRSDFDDKNEYYAYVASLVRDIQEKCNGDFSKLTLHDKNLREACNTVFWNGVEGYVNQFISKKYPTYKGSIREDMKHEICCCAIADFYKYDGSFSVTTFINQHANHACTTEIAFDKGISRYENEIMTRVRKVISGLMALGYDEEDITDADIQAADPKLSKTQIRHSRELFRSQNHQEFNPETLNNNDLSMSPEQEYIKRQEEAELAAALEALCPYESYCLKAKHGMMNPSSSDESFAEIGREPEFIAILKLNGATGCISIDEETDSEYVKPNVVQTMYHNGIRHIKKSKPFAEKYRNAINARTSARAALDAMDRQDAEENLEVFMSFRRTTKKSANQND